MNTVIDFIIRIKNSAKAKRKEVELPFSNITKEIGNVLVSEKILDEIKEVEVDGKKSLVGRIKYLNRIPVLTEVKIVSRPSLRVYTKSNEINDYQKRGKHTLIISTSEGVMTGKKAQEKKLGGELLFEVW